MPDSRNLLVRYAEAMNDATDQPNFPPHLQARDRIARILLGHPLMVLDLLNAFFDFPWTRGIDPGRMEDRGLPSIGPNLVERRHDAVWRVPIGENDSRYVCVMLEFQTDRRWNMAMRMLSYVTALYDSLLLKNELPAKHVFPAVLPIVVYAGKQRWTPTLEARELVEPAPEGLEQLQVSHRYLLLDVQRLPRLPESSRNRVEALFRVERSEKPEDLDAFVAMVKDLFPGEGYDNFKRAIIGWAYHVMQKALPSERLPEPSSVEEVQTMLQERVLPWGEQKLAEGRAEGRAEGQRELVLRTARTRFGDSVAQVLSARLSRELSVDRLEQVLELIYSCASADTLLDQLQRQEV